MAQILVSNADTPNSASFQQFSLVDVLEDGVHAGTAIIGPGPWTDPPLVDSGFWIVDISDADRATCLWVVQPEYLNDKTNKKRKYRIRQQNVPQSNIDDILATGRTSMTYATMVTIVVANPGHS